MDSKGVELWSTVVWKDTSLALVRSLVVGNGSFALAGAGLDTSAQGAERRNRRLASGEHPDNADIFLAKVSD